MEGRKGFKGYYEVSGDGKVRSKDRAVKHDDGRVRKLKGKELAQKTDKDGYKTVKLKKGGKSFDKLVHRLVAGEPKGKEVHHKNADRDDNSRSNVKGISSTENKRIAARRRTLKKLAKR